jgi:hypothetical protein
VPADDDSDQPLGLCRRFRAGLVREVGHILNASDILIANRLCTVAGMFAVIEEPDANPMRRPLRHTETWDCENFTGVIEAVHFGQRRKDFDVAQSGPASSGSTFAEPPRSLESDSFPSGQIVAMSPSCLGD